MQKNLAEQIKLKEIEKQKEIEAEKLLEEKIKSEKMEIDRIVEEEKEKMIAEFEGKNSQEDEMEIDIMKEAKIEAEIEKMKLNIEKDENFYPHRIQRMGKTPTKTSDSAFAIGTNQVNFLQILTLFSHTPLIKPNV